MAVTDEEMAQMTAARLLIRQGRRWLDLDEKSVARGARAVRSDPHYRREIFVSALTHSEYCCTCPPPSEIRAAFNLIGGFGAASHRRGE